MYLGHRRRLISRPRGENAPKAALSAVVYCDGTEGATASGSSAGDVGTPTWAEGWSHEPPPRALTTGGRGTTHRGTRRRNLFYWRVPTEPSYDLFGFAMPAIPKGTREGRVTRSRTCRRWISVRAGHEVAIRAGTTLVLEDGSTLSRSDGPIADLPVGLHSVVDSRGVATGDLAIVPAELARPVRSWGWSVMVGSLRSRADWGIGDLSDLRRFADWSHDVGAQLIFLGPMNAGPTSASLAFAPYAPSSRLFQSPLYLHLPGIAEWRRLDPDVRRLALERIPRSRTLIDFGEVQRLKLETLRLLFELYLASHAPDQALAFDDFKKSRAPELELFALYCAIEGERGKSWVDWPTELQNPTPARRERLLSRLTTVVEFHMWCQWQLDNQLSTAAARDVGLVSDLPVGSSLSGADSWMWHDRISNEFELGAPPDYFNPVGHRWGLAAFAPEALRAVNFAPFRLAVRNALRRAVGVRIDHAVGLLRQYWVPRGGSPSAGRYVYQDTTPLLDLICIEAHRARAFVLSEELGTVPAGTQALHNRGFLPYSVVMSDEFDPVRSTGVIASTTHDLPTVPGCWSGTDHRSLARAGVPSSAGFASRARRRVRDCAGGDDGLSSADVVLRLYGALARSESTSLQVSLQDALGIVVRPNVPGTLARQWPNFIQRLPLTVAELRRDRGIRRLIDTIRQSR